MKVDLCTIPLLRRNWAGIEPINGCALTAELRRGAMTVSLGGVLAFVGTVWAAFAQRSSVRVSHSLQVADVETDRDPSTAVRTAKGAEFIVPTATLVSDRVTNWTPSDDRRHVDVGWLSRTAATGRT